MINGTAVEKPTVNAAIAGPNTNPNPKDAPIMPNPFARSSGLVVSEITAMATGILPAVIPSSARAIKRTMAFGAQESKKNERAVPEMDAISRGFLPNLSDMRPIIGVDKN